MYSIRFNDIRKRHLQGIVDNCNKNYTTLRKLKVLLTVMYKFALENDNCSKDYSQYVDIIQYIDRNLDSISRQPFSRAEIETVYTHFDIQQLIEVIYKI